MIFHPFSRRGRRSAGLALTVTVAVGASLLSTPAALAAPACWDDAPTDLDGGGPDVVVGFPSYDMPGALDAGAIVVFSNVGAANSSTPRAPTARRVYTADSFGLPVQGGARFGSALFAVSDDAFREDDDDCADLFVGAPGTTVGSFTGAGRVYLLGGGEGGLRSTVGDALDAVSLSMPGGAQTDAAFGAAVSVSGGVIAIGEPRRDVGSAVDAGRVVRVDHQVVGPDPVISAITQGGGAEAGDRFGEVLDVFATWQGPVIIVGVPRENVGSRVDAGAVALIAPDDAVTLVTQNSARMAGSSEAGDLLGSSLDSFATFTTHPVIRVAAGAPGEDVGDDADAGLVGWTAIDLLSEPDRIPPLRGTVITVTQNSVGVPGSIEAGDRFGSAVILGEYGTDGGRRHLVVGSPTENLGSLVDAGMASLTRVDETGAGLGTPAAWSQDSPGVAGAAERGDQAGSALSSVRLARPVDDEDVTWQLVLATVPREDRSGVADAGLAYLGVPGGPFVTLTPPITQRGTGIGMVPMNTEW